LDAYGICDVRITAAVDDMGHDLRVDSEPTRVRRRFSASAASTWDGGTFTSRITQGVEVASPSRDAHSLKLLEGEADLLFPTTENGGLVIVKNLMAHPGEPFGDPLLKKANVTVAYLGKNVSEGGTSNKMLHGDASVPVAPTPAPRRIPFLRRPVQGKGLTFSVDDPEHHVADVVFMDSYCRRIWSGMFSAGDENRTYQLQGEVSSNAQMRVYLAVPEAIRTVPFKLENIELP